MEPERNIEKLLRAFAKKRRADAGDPPKLHPAMRRQLQAEVARHHAETPEEDSISLWQFFRQQWAFLLSFALVIFFGAALFLPALSSSKKKAQNVSAMNNLKQIGLAAQMAAADNNGRLPATLDALTNELASDKTLTDPVSGQRFVYAAAGEKLDELQSNSVLAYSPADKKDRAVLLADGDVQRMSAAQFAEATRRGLVQRVEPPALAERPGEVAMRGKLAANQPASVVAAGTMTADSSVRNFGGSGGGGAGGVQNDFGHGVESRGATTGLPGTLATPAVSNGNPLALAERKEPAQKQLFKADAPAADGLNNNSQRFRQTLAVAAKTPPVLASFEVRQNGNALAVVDRDGSIYTGSIRPEIPAAQDLAPAPAAPPAVKNEQLAGQNNLAQNNYFFRVAGQNRTSKQNVVFVGNVIQLTNAMLNTQQNQSGKNAVVGAQLATNSQNNQPQSALFSNARITGTVTVDATNRIEINAVPVAP